MDGGREGGKEGRRRGESKGEREGEKKKGGRIGGHNHTRQDLGDTGSSMNKVMIVLVVSCHVISGHHNYKWSPRRSIAE